MEFKIYVYYVQIHNTDYYRAREPWETCQRQTLTRLGVGEGFERKFFQQSNGTIVFLPYTFFFKFFWNPSFDLIFSNTFFDLTLQKEDEYDIRMLIHQSLAGCVIGKGGSKIKEIRDVSVNLYINLYLKNFQI